MFNYKTHIFKMPDARVRMPEPKALRVALYQDRRPRHQLRRGRGGRRKLPQFCRLCRQGSHVPKILRAACVLKGGFATRSPVRKREMRRKQSRDFQRAAQIALSAGFSSKWSSPRILFSATARLPVSSPK